jgi:hypothetical protein
MAEVFRDINIKEIARIYEHAHMGGLHIRGALNPNFQGMLSAEVLSLKGFEKAAAIQGNITQNLSQRYYNPSDGIARQEIPIGWRLTLAYTDLIYNAAADTLGFPRVKIINSLGINMYPKGSGGIGYHKDYASDVNLIGIVSVEGSAKFFLAKSKEGKDEISFIVEAGDLVLMRSNIGQYRKGSFDLRPLHKVESTGEERYSMLLRNSTKVEN